MPPLPGRLEHDTAAYVVCASILDTRPRKAEPADSTGGSVEEIREKKPGSIGKRALSSAASVTALQPYKSPTNRRAGSQGVAIGYILKQDTSG